MSLIPLATAKQFLRIDHSAEDDALQIILDAAESWVADYANIHLCPSGETEHDEITEDLDGGTLYLWPTQLPVRSITSIKDRMDDEAEMADPEYSISEHATRIERWCSTYENGVITPWDAGRKRYRVTYEAGYLDTELPADFKRAVMHYVFQDYHGRDKDSAHLYAPDKDKALDRMIRPFSLRRLIA